MVQLAQQFLSPLEFRFVVTRIPKTNFFVQQAVLPGLDLSVIEQPAAFNTIRRTGNTLRYSDLSITFKVDEDMENYRELYDWMVGLGFPREFPEYKDLYESQNGLYSDASLVIMSSQKNSNIVYKFNNLFPINLSPLNMDITSDDLIYIDCTVDFRYDTFTIERLRDD